MSARLNNKVAIVTGGASGFGAGIAHKFVAEGAQVLIADRDLGGAQAVAARAGPAALALNMASTAGVSPRPRLSWYNASKGRVITATRANAVELAPFGIRVVA